jgi:cell division septation protein DedD
MNVSVDDEVVYEIDLGRKELAILLAAVVVSSVVIFFAGMTWGRHLDSPVVVAEAPTQRDAKPKVEPPAPPPASSAKATPAPAAEAPVAQAPPPGDYAVQVLATRARQQAEDILRRLEQRGYLAYVNTSGTGASPLYRVRVGTFANQQGAQFVVERLRQEEALSGFVIRARDARRQ